MGLWLNGAKYELTTALARPMSPMRGRARKMKRCTTSRGEPPAAFKRRHDPVHCLSHLRFKIVRQVLQDLIAPVGVIVIDGQGRSAGEPKQLAALENGGNP